MATNNDNNIDNWTSVAVRREPTKQRLQRLGNLGDSYDSTITKLLDIGEKKLLAEVWEEAYIVNSQI